MKMNRLFYLLALGGLVLPSQLKAQSPGYDFTQDENVGYDFTQEEDSAEADKRKREQQSLIYNGPQYVAACRKAYQEDIMWVISACCDGIIGNRDLVECIYDPDPATLYREAASKISSKHLFAPSEGQFMDGVLTRSMLAQAKPNINSKQYAEIEHMITRAEMLTKWFLGPFGKACMAHNYDYLKEVQRVARFKEYTKTDRFRSMDSLYVDMQKAFYGEYVRARADKGLAYLSSNKHNSYVFFHHFHNSVSQSERDGWLGFVVLGGSKSSPYTGPVFGVDAVFRTVGVESPFKYFDIRGGKVITAATAEAAELASYMRYFDFWSENRITAAWEAGNKANALAKNAADDFFSGIHKVAGEIVVKEDADFKRLVGNVALYALDKMVTMDDELIGFEKFLRDNTVFLKNRNQQKSRASLQYQVQTCVDYANMRFERMIQTARQTVPESDPARSKN